MKKRNKLALSIRKQFGCSQSVADDWADDVIASESQPNGRIQPFQEFAESTANNVDDLSELIKARARARAGIKTFRNHDDLDEMKSRIAYRGGIRL